MPSSVTIGPAWDMDGPTWNGANLRPIFSGLLAAAAIQVMSGVLPGGGAWFVTAGSGMQVVVGAGTGVIASSAGVTAGGYLATVNTTTALSITGSDPVNPRIDLVCATVSDVGSSASAWLLQVITGTPAGSPSAPSLPSNSYALATVLVPANSLSVSSGNITDERVFTALQGGIIPVPNLSGGLAALTPYQGLYVHDRQSLRLARVSVGGAAVQPTLLPFTPVRTDRTTNATSLFPNPVTILSAAFSADGSTDFEFIIKWPSLTCPSGSQHAVMSLDIDGVIIYQHDASAPVAGGGGSFTHITQSGIDRPSAGTHTATVVMTGQSVSTVTLTCSATAAATLYVRPVPL